MDLRGLGKSAAISLHKRVRWKALSAYKKFLPVLQVPYTPVLHHTHRPEVDHIHHNPDESVLASVLVLKSMSYSVRHIDKQSGIEYLGWPCEGSHENRLGLR